MTKVLFLCTGNSCRSQMAEGWTRELHGTGIQAFSAGIVKHGMNPRAITVMAEAGVDISGHASKTIADLDGQKFDFVITLCKNARETCPFYPGAEAVLHHGFDDPPRLAESEPEEEAKLNHYRRVRDEIRDFVMELPEWLRKHVSVTS
ncbi:arsenate reductase ArsC [Thermodesulfobacteriota bacterium]